MMNKQREEGGFSYIDVLVAVTILMVGIMALVGAMTSAVMMTTQGEQQLMAKQYALSTLEAVFSARDIQAPGFGWESTRNVKDGGIFPDGREPIWPTFGQDGIIGTTDDAYGPDGKPASGDEGQALPGYQRQINITDIPNPERPRDPISLRQIDVTVFYNLGTIQRQETVTTFIADYRTKPE